MESPAAKPATRSTAIDNAAAKVVQKQHEAASAVKTTPVSARKRTHGNDADDEATPTNPVTKRLGRGKAAAAAEKEERDLPKPGYVCCIILSISFITILSHTAKRAVTRKTPAKVPARKTGSVCV